MASAAVAPGLLSSDGSLTVSAYRMVIPPPGFETPRLPGRTLRIVSVADYFGAGNIGDDLMVEGLLHLLVEAEARGAGPFELVLLCPHRLVSQMRRFPQVTWCRPGVGYFAALADADLMMLPGDTPFMPEAWVWDAVPPRVAAGGSCPLLCLAVGAEEPAEKQLPAARDLLRQACFTTARDATSVDVLRTLAPESADRIEEGADLANLTLRRLFRHRGLPTDARPIPLALLWYAESTSAADISGLRTFVNRRAPGDWPVFLSHEYRLEYEYAHFRQLFPRGHPRPRFIRPRYSATDMDALVAPYREIGTVVASRYHALLAAAWAGCRVAALPRSLKVVGLARSLEIPLVAAPISADELERAVGEARTISRAKLDDLAERALETGVDAIIRTLPSAPQRPRAHRSVRSEVAEQRILVIRQDSIGDAVLTSAMLRELRRSFPKAVITLVTSLVARPLFAHCPYIDHLAAYDFSGWGNAQTQAALASLFAEQMLRPMNFDVALLPRYDFDYWGGRAMIAACGAPVRVGYAAGLTTVGRQNREMVADPFSLTLAPDDIRHEAERNLALVEAIGGSIFDRHLELWPLPADRREAASRLTAFRGADRVPLIALAPGAQHEVKIWPTERFIAVAQELVDRVGARVVVVGGNSERAAGSAIAAALDGRALDLTGQLDLNRTFAAIESCDLLISNDSAPVHLASAACTPVVVLSPHARNGDANAYLSPQRFGAWLTSHRTLQPAMQLDPCSGTCTASEAHCILQISSAAAVSASLELLESAARPARGADCDDTRGDSPKQAGEGAVRFWRALADQHGPAWKQATAATQLRFLLSLLGKMAHPEPSRVLIVNDGPRQTLVSLQAKLRVAVDPNTDALIQAGLLDPALGDGQIRYVSASMIDNPVQERQFDLVLVSCPVRNADEGLRLLRALFRVAAPGARIALNLHGENPDVRLPPDLLAAALTGRQYAHDVALLEDGMTLRGSVEMRG
jgi:ADP-heptose:LPS heptosyltransferase